MQSFAASSTTSSRRWPRRCLKFVQHFFRRSWLVALSVLLVLDSRAVQSDADDRLSQVSVLYPSVDHNYKRVYERIIEGIDDGGNEPVAKFVIDQNTDPSTVERDLRKNGTRIVIAIGKQSIKATRNLPKDISIVATGVVSIPEGLERFHATQVFVPDPLQLFTRMKLLKPTTRKIYTVYDPVRSEWLVRLAKEEAKSLGIELVAYSAQDLPSAIKRFQSIFEEANPETDVVWVTGDITASFGGPAMTMVLQESWQKSVAVISSVMDHARLGTLMSMYPDEYEAGKALRIIATSLMNGGSRQPPMPLRSLRSGLNTRTMSHLGLRPDAGKLRAFDFLYPEP